MNDAHARAAFNAYMASRWDGDPDATPTWEGTTDLTQEAWRWAVSAPIADLDRAHAILRDLVAMRETLGHYDFAVLDGLVARARVEIRARDEAEGGSRGGEPDVRI